MTQQSTNLILSLKTLFAQQKFSDFMLEIYEYENLNNSSRNKGKASQTRSCNAKKQKHDCTLYCSLPIHSCILALQSTFFSKMFESPMKESKSNNVILKVEEGSGAHVKLFIESFYDHNIFDGMDIYTYLNVILIADRYSCDIIIQQAFNKLNSVKIGSLENCEKCAEYVQLLSKKTNGLSILSDLIKNIFDMCCVYASSVFCPLEVKRRLFKNHFLKLSFGMLLALLKCKKPLAYHENSILYYILSWLEFDETRQTEDIIKELLCSLNYSLMTPDFLIDVISKDHAILNKWSGFIEWFWFVVCCHAHSQNNPNLPLLDKLGDIDYNRNYKPKGGAMFYSVNFHKSVDEEDMFEKDYTFFVYKGYEIYVDICFIGDRLDRHIPMEFVMNVMNVKSNSDKELMSTDIAIGFDTNTHQVDSLDSSIFHQMKKRNCTASNFLIEQDGAFYSIGKIKSSCYKKLEKFSLYLAFKEIDEEWSTFFPEFINKDAEMLDIL